MKSTLIILLCFTGILTTYAQKGLHIGANYMALSPSIINQNTWGIGREYDYEFTMRSSFGIDLGFNFSDQFGFRTGYWLTTLGQDYADSYSGSEWTRELELDYSFIPLMLQVTSTKAKVNFLFGAGVLVGALNEASQVWLRDGESYSEDIQNPITGDNFDPYQEDVSERFEQSELMLNFDLGGRMKIATNLNLDLTLNMAYGLTDINAKDWRIPDPGNEYELSRNAFWGLKLGLLYVLFGDE